MGHAYMALINQAVARDSGGGFTVRWDDSHPQYQSMYGKERVAATIESQKRELAWIGIDPDWWVNQSDLMPEVHAELTRLGWQWMDEIYPTWGAPAPMYPTDDRLALYPCSPRLTAEKVVMDHNAGVNLLIRGIDLLGEHSLYTYYCRQWGFPEPFHVYLPRLRGPNGDMSKSNGGTMLADLRASGYTSEYVRGLLEKACLRHPGNGWVLHNLRAEPHL